MKPEETIDFHIRWAWSKISRMYNVEAAKHGSSMSAGYVLLNIDKDGTPSTKLGPKMGMESRSLTRTLKRLEDDGLIRREPDREDKRMVRVYLTDKGNDMRNTSREVVLKFNDAIKKRIPPDQIDSFFEVMEQVNDLLDKNNIFENGKH